MSKLDDIVTACECCEGITALTPATLNNRPGLSSLAYRVGRHAHFKTTMLARLSTLPALAGLTTRQNDDLTIALLDAWATVADVLTFYQERMANEGFLRTATERRSLLELARTIGYELRPGVAASTYLAFTVDGTSESRQKFIIPAGTRAQSIPGSEELPQTFETGEEIIARPEWNEMKPRTTVPQFFNSDTRTFYFKGIDTKLKPGDWMLLLARDSSEPDDQGDIQKEPLQVMSVEVDDINDRTRVELDENPPALPSYKIKTLTFGAFPLTKQSMTGANVSSIITGATWSSADLAAFTAVQQWPSYQLFSHINTGSKAPKPPKDTGVFAMRIRTAPFGHNAQRWDTTPKEWRIGEGAPYPSSWEDAKIITKAHPTVIYLENTFPEIQANSWVVIKSSTQAAKAYEVKQTHEKSLADFGLSAKAAGLTLDTNEGLINYKVRETTIFANSEKLDLVELPIEDNVAGDILELASMQIDLEIGQTAILTGERADLEGVTTSEVVTFAGVFHTGHFTQLTFTRPLKNPYKREMVTLNANVAPATHGETRQEILGSGDAALALQRFTIRQVPLTYVSAPVPSGSLSTLELRVNSVLWHETPDLYRIGSEDRNYILRHHDAGEASILFGDGAHGMRPPTGEENITATYRTGIGTDGLLNEGQISLLLTQPLGVRNVTNPLAPTGAEDPETRDQARANAPFTVLTLDRIVSLQDFEDFARAFSGIGKAGATWLWDGQHRLVHVTVAAANGEPVDPQSALYQNLFEAMNGARDPFQPLRLDSFEKLLFNLDAAVRVHPDYLPETVLAEIENELRRTFSFRARALGLGIALSQVMAVMQQIKGVQGVDVNAFYFSHDTTVNPSLQMRLGAAPATLKKEIEITGDRIQPAQLLMITPAPITLSVMA